ncbi:MAG: phosphatase PAP2 family protein [Candidatus Binatia bacterium]
MSARWKVLNQPPVWSTLEIGTLISVLVIAGGLLLFAKLVDHVRAFETHAFDQAVLLAFRTPGDLADPIGPAWLELLVRDITSLGGITLVTLITVAVIGFLLIDGKRAAALLVLASVGGGSVLSSLLKIGIDRPRPDLVAHLVEVSTASFPSGHAMLSAVIYLTLGALLSRVEARRRVKIYFLTVAVILTFLVGLSRIYLGVHWPTDVLAGWCAGSAWAAFCWRVALALQRGGEVEGET